MPSASGRPASQQREQRSLTTWKRLHLISSSVQTEFPQGRTAGQMSRSRACAHSTGSDRVQSSRARCRIPLLAFSRPQLKLPRFHRPGAGHQPASHPGCIPEKAPPQRDGAGPAAPRPGLNTPAPAPAVGPGGGDPLPDYIPSGGCLPCGGLRAGRGLHTIPGPPSRDHP